MKNDHQILQLAVMFCVFCDPAADSQASTRHCLVSRSSAPLIRSSIVLFSVPDIWLSANEKTAAISPASVKRSTTSCTVPLI